MTREIHAEILQPALREGCTVMDSGPIFGAESYITKAFEMASFSLQMPNAKLGKTIQGAGIATTPSDTTVGAKRIPIMIFPQLAYPDDRASPSDSFETLRADFPLLPGKFSTRPRIS